MSTVKLTLKNDDIRKLYERAAQVERNLTNKTGDVYRYVFKIGDGYRQAVLSGIGKTTTGVMSLKSFLGQVQTTDWVPLNGLTTKYKQDMNWSLEIWKASGAVSDVMSDSSKSIIIDKKSTGIDMFAGIDGTKFAEAFDHAYRAEYGGYAEPLPPNSGNWEGRALFTLLNALLESKMNVVLEGLNDAIRQAIARAGWGS